MQILKDVALYYSYRAWLPLSSTETSINGWEDPRPFVLFVCKDSVGEQSRAYKLWLRKELQDLAIYVVVNSILNCELIK